MYATPKVSFVFDRRKRASRTTNGAIEIEVCYAGERLRMTTGIGVLIHEWKEGRVVGRIDARLLNNKLNEKYNEIYDAVLKMVEEDNVCLDKLKKYSGTRKVVETKKALDWIEERINGRHDIRESTRRQHLVMLRSLRTSKLFYSFKDFTTANIKRWNDILSAQLKCQTSVHGYHKRLKPYIAEALQFGLLDKSPYQGYHVNCGKSAKRKFITEDARNAIEALELKGGEEKARDLFIFACYTGLSYSDIVKISPKDIREENGNLFLQDVRQKTGSEYKLLMLPKARAILEKYNYNLNIISNQKANYYLKIVAAKAGVKIELSMHMGRHTFATWALSQGISIEVVSKMLAHQDIKTTQIYAKILQEDVTRGFMELGKIACGVNS